MDYGEGVDAGVGRSAASMMPINGRRLSSEDFMGLDLSSEDFWTLALRRDIMPFAFALLALLFAFGKCMTQSLISCLLASLSSSRFPSTSPFIHLAN